MKILSIGNSFSVDTMKYIPDIARSLGICDFKLGNLYIGGCSIRQHYHNAIHDSREYLYYTHTGEGWEKTPGYSICEAVQSEDWDVISIQHGTKDGSRYTEPESYRQLEPLIRCVKEMARSSCRIAFNMAWVPEPYCGRAEIASFGDDQLLMYEALANTTLQWVASLGAVDLVSPAGTAIQNGRACLEKKLTRDDFHLSYGLGRYMAALTFLKALWGVDLSQVTWAPEDVTREEMVLAVKAADAAVRAPYRVTDLQTI